MPWLCISSSLSKGYGNTPEWGRASRAAVFGRQALIVTSGRHSLSAVTAREIGDRLGGGPWYVVAADGGADTCSALGLTPDVVIGDMDSLPPDSRGRLSEAGCPMICHPVEKDKTDTHLAMDLVGEMGFQDVCVTMHRSGRLDHVLGVIWAAFGLATRGVRVRFVDAGFEAALMVGPSSVSIAGEPGLTVSLLSLPQAQGITLSGMKYPLNKASLSLGETRGISNETVDSRAGVRMTAGVLLVMVTHTHD